MEADISITLIAGQNQIITYPKKCIINNAVCNDSLQHAESSCSVDFVYDQELFAFLALQTDVIAVVKDGQNTVFTGLINTDLSWTDSGNPSPIEQFSVTIQDYTSLFDKKTESEIGLVNTTVSAIVSKVCLDCNVTIARNQIAPVTEVRAFIIDEGKSYKDALNNLLFQYGYSYTFNDYGEFVYFDYKTIPQNPETLDDEDIITGAKFSRLNRKYSGAKVTYNSLTKKTNELVYFEGGGYNSDNTIAPIILQPGTYYPFDSTPAVEADSGQVYQSFRGGYAETKTKYNGEKEYQSSEETSLLYTENHSVVQDWEKGNVQINRQEFGFRKASVRLKNIHASEDANLYSLSIRADAWYRDKKCSSLSGSSANPFTCDCEYIYVSADADTLASILARFYSGAHYKITLQTERQIVQGAYMSIDTGLSGFTATALCISSSYDIEKNIYSSVFVTVSESQISLTRSAVSETSPNKGALQATQTAIQEAHSSKIRTLQNLEAAGIENEVAYYQGNLFVYRDESWRLINADNYVGIYSSSLPEQIEGNFFLAGADFAVHTVIDTDSGILELDDFSLLSIDRSYKKGMLYVSHNDLWEVIEDRNDYRYLLATNDLSEIGKPISPRLQSVISGVTKETVGRYRGPSATIPLSPEEGDYFLYTGSDSSLKGYLVRYQSGSWEKMDVTGTNYQFYMTALSDVLSENQNDTSIGLFSTIFAEAIASSKAMINELQTQKINLQTGGIIQGNFDGYAPSGRITEEGNTGFAIDSYGKAVFNDIRIRAGIQSQGFYYKRLSVGFSGIPTSTKLQQLFDFINSHSKQNWPDYLTTQYLGAAGKISLTGTDYSVSGVIQYVEINWDPSDIYMYIYFIGTADRNGTFKLFPLNQAYLKVGKNYRYNGIYFDMEGFICSESGSSEFVREQISIGSDVSSTQILLLV